MKTITTLFVFLTGILLASPGWADLLIEDAKITDIMLGPWESNSFAVKTTGTEDLCSSTWVVFARENFSNPESYDRAYSMALAAISANKVVLILGDTDDCLSANMIGFID